MKYNIEHKDFLNSILVSYKYNRDEKYLIEVCEEVKNRINKGPYRTPTDEADIIMGAIVYRYGDYGTSPRYGWFYDKKYNDDFIKVLDDCISDLKDYLSEVSDE